MVLEAWCEVVAEQGAWEEAPKLVTEARRHAEEAELLALPHYADRLEGLAAAAAGDSTLAARSLSRALGGFDALEARWEAARTALALGETLARAGEPEAARHRVAEAVSVFSGLRSLRELRAAEELARRLG
jgi:hypothetical protein